jgi:hypothetical protein
MSLLLSVFLLPVLALLFLCLAFFLIAFDLMRESPLFPTFHKSWAFLFAFLIGLELWSLFDLGEFSSVFLIVPLAMVFAYLVIKGRKNNVDTQLTKSRTAFGVGVLFLASLIGAAVFLINEFILIVYLHHRFPGQLFEID